ncbi:MAG TPA: hypothetical protein IAA04_11660 [Candidatus Lachnoclostridium pullistercoris]|uniref:PTS HPr component phosphorylation site n=1 Tax=Candidatus Lachnoclostridium pullistercoris TaxID=2838632 RepID=A0A9D2PFJ1_9FIRM|nr:hypothetical protein [Candidatus Lachnoclostridium pullistercoris]
MTKTEIVFWNMDSIMQFMEIIGRHDYEAELVCGGRTVNAKALLDVISLHAFQASELRIFSDSCEDLLKDLDLYMDQYRLERAAAC